MSLWKTAPRTHVEAAARDVVDSAFGSPHGATEAEALAKLYKALNERDERRAPLWLRSSHG